MGQDGAMEVAELNLRADLSSRASNQSVGLKPVRGDPP